MFSHGAFSGVFALVPSTDKCCVPPLSTSALRAVSYTSLHDRECLSRCLFDRVFLGVVVSLPLMMDTIAVSHVWAVSMLRQLSWMGHAHTASTCQWLC